MKISKLATTLLQIEQISSRNEITELLSSLFKELTPEESKIVSYLVLSRIVPLYESLEFNLSTKLVIRSIAIASKKTEDEVTKLYDKQGDLGDVIFSLNEKENGDGLLERINKIGEQEDKNDDITI